MHHHLLIVLAFAAVIFAPALVASQSDENDIDVR
jgi:hypothetical protein